MPPNNGTLPLWWTQASFLIPLVVVHHTLAPQAVSRQPTPVLPLCLTFKAQASAPAPVHPSRGVSHAGACVRWQHGQINYAGLSLLCPLKTGCCTLLRSSPSVLVDLPASEGTSQGVKSFPLSQFPHRGIAPIPIPFSPSFFNHPFYLFLFTYLMSVLGELGSIPGLGRSPGEGNGNPLQYSCLENPMDRGAW